MRWPFLSFATIDVRLLLIWLPKKQTVYSFGSHMHWEVSEKKMEYSDSLELDQLKQRLEILSPNIEKLYREMWTRNNNSQIYREQAAKYFYYMLTFSLTVFDFMVTEDPFLQETLVEQEQVLSDAEIYKRCKSMEVYLITRSADLLEIVPADEKHSKGLRFIHRCARDFLLDTLDGSEILSYFLSEISADSRMRLRINLVGPLVLPEQTFLRLVRSSSPAFHVGWAVCEDTADLCQEQAILRLVARTCHRTLGEANDTAYQTKWNISFSYSSGIGFHSCFK